MTRTLGTFRAWVNSFATIMVTWPKDIQEECMNDILQRFKLWEAEAKGEPIYDGARLVRG